MFGEEAVSSIIDTGSETRVIYESLYNQLVLGRLPTYEISISNTVLVTGFGNTE
jgi:hypothetical protein